MDIDDLRQIPAYSFVEAAHYLNVPPSTLSAWCKGQSYTYHGETRRFRSVICLDGQPGQGLSFMNLVEAHVLVAIRRHHRVPLPRVRQALEFVRRELRTERPLADASFETDGVDLFVHELERLVNVSRAGQLEMKPVISTFLKRVKRDPERVPVKLFPFTRKTMSPNDPAPVEIDPRIAFGRPVLVGRAVPTAVLADRFKAGDSLADIADDYVASAADIEEAIRCEINRREAA